MASVAELTLPLTVADPAFEVDPVLHIEAMRAAYPGPPDATSAILMPSFGRSCASWLSSAVERRSWCSDEGGADAAERPFRTLNIVDGLPGYLGAWTCSLRPSA